jgi:hypothetical protein
MTALALIALIVVLIPCVFFGLKLARLETQRHASRAHIPMPNELWTQDGQLPYVEHADAQGVHLLTFDPRTHVLTRWADTWNAWSERCRARVVIFTGRRGSLNPWEAMVT